MKIRAMHVVLALGALVLAASPALAQGSPDLITLNTAVGFATSNPGGFNEGTCTVFNNTTGTIRVRLDAQVTYADGTVSRLSNLGQPITLEADQGFELNILFIVPEDAALGTATFQCDASATGGGHEREIGTATFEVVTP